MSICLCSSLLPREGIKRLEEEFDVIPLPPDENLASPVRCHPDMLCAVMDGVLYFHESYLARYPALAQVLCQQKGLILKAAEGPRAPLYPEDVALNALVLPGALVCLPAHTSPHLLTDAEGSGRKILKVKQGYAACSSLATPNGVLTSDPGIHRTLTTVGIRCTLMKSEGIRLPGYDIGFIGGCGGIYGSTLYLFGQADSVPDGEKIYAFAKEQGLTLCPLWNGPLTDYGGLKFV